MGNPGLSKQASPDGFPSKGELAYFIPISRQNGNNFPGIGIIGRWREMAG
jgi:hypothetical protein